MARIRRQAIEIIRDSPGGMRYSDLARQIHNGDSSLNLATIEAAIWNLDTLFDEVEKPSRGLFRMVGTAVVGYDVPTTSSPRHTEDAFYKPFADWLKNDLEDVTKAIPLGGQRFKDKVGNAGRDRQEGLPTQRHRKVPNRDRRG